MFVLVGVLGLLLGSFTTVLVHRIPREIPLGFISHTRSRCPSCDKVIPWYQNVPIFAYLFLRGRCAQCEARIPVRYLLIELSTLAIFLLTFWIYDNGRARPLDMFVYYAELIKLLVFCVALVATVFIDIEFRIIPDRFSLGGWVVALAAAFLWEKPPFMDSLIGGLLGAGLFYAMAWGYEKIKGVEGLGLGDVKMLGWLGAWVGGYGVPFTILGGSLTGLIVGVIAMRTSKEGFQTAIPFGPFLALGGYFAWALGAMGYW
jgi:leader peptidase (prepilin peptidase)/N-methyltransferase